MFSFFRSTKKSPAVSPTDHKTEEHTQKSGDDFVLVNPSNPNPNPASSYPPMYPQFNPQAHPATTPHNHPLNRQFSVTVNYTASVPFKLNQALIDEHNNDAEVWNFKLREMNSLIQRLNMTDYDFKLERSVLES